MLGDQPFDRFCLLVRVAFGCTAQLNTYTVLIGTHIIVCSGSVIPGDKTTYRPGDTVHGNGPHNHTFFSDKKVSTYTASTAKLLPLEELTVIGCGVVCVASVVDHDVFYVFPASFFVETALVGWHFFNLHFTKPPFL